MAVHGNFHAICAVGTPPVVASAEISIALEWQLKVPDLFLLFRTNRLQRRTMGLGARCSLHGPADRLDSIRTECGSSKMHCCTIVAQIRLWRPVGEVNNTSILTDNSADLRQSGWSGQQEIDREALEANVSTFTLFIRRNRLKLRVMVMDEHDVVDVFRACRFFTNSEALHQQSESSITTLGGSTLGGSTGLLGGDLKAILSATAESEHGVGVLLLFLPRFGTCLSGLVFRNVQRKKDCCGLFISWQHTPMKKLQLPFVEARTKGHSADGRGISLMKSPF